MTADRPREQVAMTFGDHATIFHGSSGNSVGAPPPRGRTGWGGTGKVVVGVATVISAVLAAVTLWMTWPDPAKNPEPARSPGAAVAPPATTAPVPAASVPAAAPPPDQPAVTRPALYDGALTLSLHGGFDLDEGRATRQTRQDGATDLYLSDNLAIFATGVYQDSYGGENGAYDRCRAKREAGGMPLPQAIGIGFTQYCFTSSAGRPGWLRVVRMQSVDSVLVEAVIWAR